MEALEPVCRTVVVTGASAGMKRACAVAFAARGDRLALIARGRPGLEGAVREAEEARAAKVVAIEADVADPQAVEAATARVEAELGLIEVWVNDAFASVFAPFAEITPKEFLRITEATYLGSVYATRAALERMLPRNRGVIVQVGSADSSGGFGAHGRFDERARTHSRQQQTAHALGTLADAVRRASGRVSAGLPGPGDGFFSRMRGARAPQSSDRRV
ncbi:SDR family NAD(P)-dependent oxidoreductase [Streptomyces sp. CB01881]|uniref:SDR family NAD(P)-dependent oxidoreductase n=1 Tax=Streptomyces sp. CB01881 TaxID=2078691 RepID=UPI000CDC3641|nr:SDR family NAD(P)-dependent oxidoreductase [Streptomyces sp. CB01881]AUY47916.1 hypothetical protein C2142_01845 [Streptomyces sp. CB01881]TYC76392.1 SDR family NAD(P)-dependent oxidoreductase [Streptomyces sp. CB01881]